MYRETKSVARTRACKTLGRALAVLFFATAFLRPDLARSGSFHGGGFPGGGSHPGTPAFHGGGFHPGAPGFAGNGFHAGFPQFHERRFHHHGFRRGIVVVPAFGAWWWGGGWGIYILDITREKNHISVKELAMTASLTDPIFTDETAAREHFEAIRWPNGPICPHCGADGVHATRLAGKSHPRWAV